MVWGLIKRISSSSAHKDLKFCTHVYICHSWHSMSIQKSLMSSKTPWRTIWKHKKNPYLQWKRPEHFHRASFMLIHIIPDDQNDLDSIQESRMSSKSPWKMVWKHVGEYPVPVHLETWKLALIIFDVLLCHARSPESCRLHSQIRNIL